MISSLNQINRPIQNGKRVPLLARPRLRRWILLILIVWLALWLRVWQLDVLPPGLHYDEAFKGVMARDVLSGANRPIFFTANFGEEPLQIYATALFFTLFGQSPWSIRLVSAVFGLVFVVALYACARALFPVSHRLALVSAFLAATLYWSINFSRIGLETNSLPLLLALSAAALGITLRRQASRWAALAGLLIGAVLYTYLASRLWLLVVLFWFLYLLLLHPAAVRAHFSRWLTLGAVGLLTLAPLGLFFLMNPVALTGRSGTVFTPEFLSANLVRTAGMFFVAGDMDPRDNLPGRPALDPILAIMFLVGIGVALRRFRQPMYGLLLIWLVVMCLPSALTEFAPNARRAIGALPAIILLCALGFDWIWQHLVPWRTRQNRSRAPGPNRWRVLSATALVLALVVSGFWSGRAYFSDWASGTGLFYSFDAGLLQVAQALAARPPGDALYLSPKYDDHYTVLWALNGRPLSSFDGRRVMVFPNSMRPASYGIITREDTQTTTVLEHGRNDIKTLDAWHDPGSEPYAVLVSVPAVGSSISDGIAYLEDWASLQTASVKPDELSAGGSIHVQLQWRAGHPAPQDYTTFVHLVGPVNPATGSPLWDQADEQPGGGTYPTTHWRDGETIVETFVLTLPPEALPGDYRIETGMYLLASGARVPLTLPDETRAQDDALPLVAFSLKAK